VTAEAVVTPLERGCQHATADVAALPDTVAYALTASAGDADAYREGLYRLVRVCLHAGLDRDPTCAVVRQWEPAQVRMFGKPGDMLCTVTRLAWAEAHKTLPRTDMGNTTRLAAQHGTDLAWTPELGGWLVWDGARWRPDDGTDVQAQAKRVARKLMREADDLAGQEGASEEEVKKARSWAMQSQSAARIKAMGELVRSEPGIPVPVERWDADPELLACRNATVRLTPDGVNHWVGHRRGDHVTRVTDAVCKTVVHSDDWEAFLARALPDPEVRRFFQKLAAYTLYGGNPERLLIILKGPTSTGKTTVMEVIAGVLGDYASTFALSMFRGKETDAPRPDLLEVLPARLIFTTEASDRWKLHADEVKRLTGNDTVSARNMNAKRMVKGRPAFTPVIATNEAPTIIGADTALWRRLVVVPFTVQIPKAEEDRTLAARLVREQGTGILTWLLAGWDAYVDEGLADVPTACVEAAMDLRSELSLVDRWLAEETEQAAEYIETVEELWGAFSSWCARSGVTTVDRGNKIGFGKELTAKGFGDGHTGDRRARKRARTGLRVSAEVKDQRAAEELAREEGITLIEARQLLVK
jgi:putative DNA primase/helicase